MSRFLVVLLAAALLLTAVGLVMFFGQRSVVFPRPMELQRPAPRLAERIALPVGSALLLTPPTAGPAPLIIFFHGNAETAEDWVDPFDAMRREGWAVLLVEYPGYHETPGSPSQESIFQAAEAAFDWGSGDARIDRSRIVGYGRSLGSGPAAHLGASRKLAGLVIESGFTGVRPLAARFLVPGFLVRDPFDNLSALERYRGPLLVIHGMADEVIPVAHGRALAAAVPGSTLVIERCGHNDCPRPWPVLRNWLEHHGLAGESH